MRALRSVFPGASEQTLQRFAGIAHARSFVAGQNVFRSGDASDDLFIVISGRIAVTLLSPEGVEVLLSIINPGEVLGEIGVLDGGPRSANATAVRETRTLVLRQRDFLHLLEVEPSAARSILVLLCARLRQATSFVEDAVLMPLDARLLHRIQALARTFGRLSGSGSLRVEHGLSQQELGDSIGASRVSVNKQLNAWRAQGLLDVERGCIVVHDMDRLEAAVSDARAPATNAADLHSVAS